MVGFVLQRRRDRIGSVVSALMLAGLIIPPAIVPTIYVLQALGLFKTLPGLTLVEVAFLLPFSVLIFRAFVASIPRELDEAAIMDGASPLRLFFSVIFPLLRPAVITVIVVATVAVYNDFVNPLYFLPGTENATVQLTLFNFQSQFNTRWHLLFADVLLITIPPLIVFLFFQRQIVSGHGRRGGQGMTLVVQRLRSQLPDGVLAFGAEQPRLSWQVSASHPGLVQLGYEIEASESPGFETVLATTDQRDGDAQVAVPAPGGPLRSRERAPLSRPRAGRLGLVGLERRAADRGGPPRARRVVRSCHHAPGRPGQPRSVTVAGAPAGVRRAGTDRQRPAPRDGARRAPRVPERSPGLRRPAGTGLDVLSPPHPGGHLRRDAPARRRGGTPSARCSGTGGTAGGSVGTRRTTDAATAGSSGWLPSSRSSASTGRAWSSRRTGAGGRRPPRSARRTCTTAARSTCALAQPGWDAPGFDDSALDRRDQRPIRSWPDRAADRAAGPADRRPAGPA